MSEAPTTVSNSDWTTVSWVPGVVHLWNTARVEGNCVILGCKVSKPMADGSTEISHHDSCVVYCASDRQARDYARSIR